MRSLKARAGIVLAAPLTLLAFALAGCGGGGGGPNSAPVAPSTTGTFRSEDVSVLVGSSNLVKVGRGFVTLNNGAPTAVGLEVAPEALRELPQPPANIPGVYGVALPPESVFTPFTFVALVYWSGHSPPGIDDKPHIHAIFGIVPPQLPEPPFANETVPPAQDERPVGHVPIDGADGLLPGIGLGFQDPAQPQARPGWDSTGQHVYFYKGHLSDFAVGATLAFLQRQEAGSEPARGDVIKQPQIYPRPGYYPHRYTVRFDSSSRFHVIALEDFQKAENVLVQSRPSR